MRLHLTRARHHSSLLRGCARLALVLPLAAGCTDATDRTPGLTTPDRPRVQASVAAGSTRCLPLPNVTAKNVEAGVGFDANGNGVVCERNDGTPERPLITTSDDALPADTTAAAL